MDTATIESWKIGDSLTVQIDGGQRMNQREKNRYWIVAAFFEMCERLNISQKQGARMVEVTRAMLCHIRRQRRKPSDQVVKKMGYLLYIEKVDKSRLLE